MNAPWATILGTVVMMAAMMATAKMSMRGERRDLTTMLAQSPLPSSKTAGSHPHSVRALAAAQRKIKELESSNKSLRSRISHLESIKRRLHNSHGALRGKSAKHAKGGVTCMPPFCDRNDLPSVLSGYLM
ncbi:hypothetical protein GUITHDRAFT_112559 [Guillardia theta CCMP2712]|uniref:Uncharacterized protein n=1 Tax=Guillardia theta (strain CCMP2712) TaxID=905079 RepID=L1IYK7_GUITC|nr:hypothetical protein GUITHDRAFT_112559 [Guillardia theta CCMP2712]EKX41348.1 hypothetical protein GUITHDRAFT_112559 [Guillardia theta CCMP2712]|eukprot:XP_005828328.1 hypothetical protein GUITHDRAFT_112559 [Guillardia theta CCMP2712]